MSEPNVTPESLRAAWLKAATAGDREAIAAVFADLQAAATAANAEDAKPAGGAVAEILGEGKCDWFDKLRRDSNAMRELDAYAPYAPAALPVPDVGGELPTRLLALSGDGRKAMSGAVLSKGGVCLLAGEGGVGKSAYAAAVALGAAHVGDGKWGGLGDGLLHGEGHPALVATWEDALAVTARRLRQLAEKRGGGDWDRALRRVHLLDLAGHPLHGPCESYNERPDKREGWRVLWGEAERTGAKLIVIDPATAAYCGVGHGVAEVREFMQALAIEAGERGAGVLLVAHSTKEARRGKSKALDPGKVAGSAAWTDAARGVLTLSWGDEAGERVLGVSKANYGPSRLTASVQPVRDGDGGVVGLDGDGWSAEDAPDGDVPDFMED